MLNFPQLCDFSPMCQKFYLNFSQSGEHCDITFHKLFCNLRYVLGLKKNWWSRQLRCVYPVCKCTRLACLLSFESLIFSDSAHILNYKKVYEKLCHNVHLIAKKLSKIFDTLGKSHIIVED